MDSSWLRAQFRSNPEKSKADLAEALGLGAPAVSKMLADRRQIKAQEYLAMRRFFGLPVDGESAAREVTGDRRYVIDPLVANMGEKDYAPDQQDAWIMPASLLQGRTKAAPGNIKIFAVQEKTMTPDFLPGEHVLVDLSDTQPSPPGVFIISDGLGFIIRHCAHIPYSQPPIVQLSTASDKDEPYRTTLDKAGIIGRVIAKLEWL